MLRTKAQEVAVVDLQSLVIIETERKQCLTILPERSSSLLLLFLFREYNSFGLKKRIYRMCWTLVGNTESDMMECTSR
jgi:hypothetical protein